MRDLLVKLKILRSGGMPTFLGTALIIVAMAAFGVAVVTIEKRISFYCDKHIEGLPSEFSQHVAQACRDYVKAGLVERSVLREFMETYHIRYDETFVVGERGSVTRIAAGYLFRVPLCERDESGECYSYYVGAQDIAYHETGHLALLAAGVPGPEHHAIMHRYELCPGLCPDDVLADSP